MNYRSVADLNRCIVVQQHRLPRDIGLVVGIPRSGLLAANLLALHLNLPMADLEGYLAGRLINGGSRLHRLGSQTNPALGKALVIDDSVQSGTTMRKVKERIREAGLAGRVRYSCAFVDPQAKGEVDFYFEVCPVPRVFEWNLMHHPCLENSCVDIDGVLCRDPSEDENDDGPRYAKFLSEVEPLAVPTVVIGWLVTCRLERYRQYTTEWLGRHGVRYKHLVMMDYPSKAARVAAGSHGAFKASVYGSADAVLFIESSFQQATEIVRLTGRDVFCMESREMLSPGLLAKARRLSREPGAWPRPNLGRVAIHLRGWLKLRTRVRRCLGLPPNI